MAEKRDNAPFEVISLGHASLIFRVADLVIYMDPIFDDPHHDGLFEIYPRRVVHIDQLPAPTHILISHRHFDHFDINSLARFDRAVPVILPDDPYMADALIRLGFQTLIKIEDFQTLSLSSVDLFFTPSELKLPEHGVVISYEGVRIWNQVDTMPSDADLKRVVDQFGSFDMVIAPWQPILEAIIQYNQTSAFPVEEFCRFLIRAARSKGRLTLPGANGFRYRAPYDWQNALCFPATRERFVKELEAILAFDPARSVACSDPGDRWIFREGAFHKAPDPARGIIRKHDWQFQDLAFQPGFGAFIGTSQIKGERRCKEPLSEILARVQEWICKKADEQPDLFAPLMDWAVIYELTLWDGEDTKSCHMSFAEDRPQCRTGPSPYATMVTNVNACHLLDLLDRRVSWDYLIHSGAYRSHQTVFRLTPAGIEAPRSDALEDPLWAIAPFADNIRAKIDRELAQAMKVGSA